MSKEKRKGNRLESRVVKAAQEAGLEARRQPGSGVYKNYPNDAVVAHTLLEMKCGYTELSASGEKSFRFQLEWIRNVMKHAKEQGFEGGAVIVRPDGSQTCYAVVEVEYLLSLLKRASS